MILGIMQAQCQVRSAEIERHHAKVQRAVKNFRDYHGYDPDRAMNLWALIRDYSTPWRKSPIPIVRRVKR